VGKAILSECVFAVGCRWSLWLCVFGLADGETIGGETQYAELINAATDINDVEVIGSASDTVSVRAICDTWHTVGQSVIAVVLAAVALAVSAIILLVCMNRKTAFRSR
jgi:hypothetical protein